MDTKAALYRALMERKQGPDFNENAAAWHLM